MPRRLSGVITLKAKDPHFPGSDSFDQKDTTIDVVLTEGDAPLKLGITPADANNRVFVWCDVFASCTQNGDIQLIGSAAENVGDNNNLALTEIHEVLPIEANVTKQVVLLDDGSSHQGWIFFNQLRNLNPNP